MTFKRKLTQLECSIQKFLKTAAKTKQDHQQLTNFEKLALLLKKAIHAEEQLLEVEIEEFIERGHQNTDTIDVRGYFCKFS